jgi:hypothetical protein
LIKYKSLGYSRKSIICITVTRCNNHFRPLHI